MFWDRLFSGNWVEPEEMREMLAEDDDVEIENWNSDDIKDLLDELVEEGVMRERGGKYQIQSEARALEYLAANEE